MKREEPKRGLANLFCRFCGRKFTVHLSVLKRRRVEFCQDSCRLEFSDREVKRLRADDLPLITLVGDESITCNVCGRTGLESIGSHMQTHGVETHGLGHLERNILLGLGLGERAVIRPVREKMAERAVLHWDVAQYSGVTSADYGRIAQLRSMFDTPEAVTLQCRENAMKMHEAACERRALGLPPKAVSQATRALLSAGARQKFGQWPRMGLCSCGCGQPMMKGSATAKLPGCRKERPDRKRKSGWARQRERAAKGQAK